MGMIWLVHDQLQVVREGQIFDERQVVDSRPWLLPAVGFETSTR